MTPLFSSTFQAQIVCKIIFAFENGQKSVFMGPPFGSSKSYSGLKDTHCQSFKRFNKWFWIVNTISN